jgi:hypothetical protein
MIADVDATRVLVDTGSPFTLGRTASTLSLAGRSINVRRLPASLLDLDRIGQLVGERIDVVLGMDALDRIGFRLRTAPAMQIGFFDVEGETGVDLTGSGWTRVHVGRLAGVPLIEIAVPGAVRAHALFDTGAVISFAPSSWLESLPNRPFGSRSEFYIGATGLVETETPVWRIGIEIGGLVQKHEFGVMPGPMEAMLRLLGVESSSVRRSSSTRLYGRWSSEVTPSA